MLTWCNIHWPRWRHTPLTLWTSMQKKKRNETRNQQRWFVRTFLSWIIMTYIIYYVYTYTCVYIYIYVYMYVCWFEYQETHTHINWQKILPSAVSEVVVWVFPNARDPSWFASLGLRSPGRGTSSAPGEDSQHPSWEGLPKKTSPYAADSDFVFMILRGNSFKVLGNCGNCTKVTCWKVQQNNSEFSTPPQKNWKRSRCLDKVCNPCSFWWICSASCRDLKKKQAISSGQRFLCDKMFPTFDPPENFMQLCKRWLTWSNLQQFWKLVCVCFVEAMKTEMIHWFLEINGRFLNDKNPFLNKWWMERPAAVSLSASKPPRFQQKWLNILFCREQLELRVQHLSAVFKRVNVFFQGIQCKDCQQLPLVNFGGKKNTSTVCASWTLRLKDAKFAWPTVDFF